MKVVQHPVADEFERAVHEDPIQIAVNCSECNRLSILKYNFESPLDQGVPPESTSTHWLEKLSDENEGYVTIQPSECWPEVTRRIPFGVYGRQVREAWNEAETAYATGELWTASGIAYRRVLELCIQEIENEPDNKRPLGVRAAQLRDRGIISAELHDLLELAKAFGNEAAHGDALDQTDASIARDLTDAFVRQAFTIPFLLGRAKKHISDKASNKRAKTRRKAKSTE